MTEDIMYNPINIVLPAFEGAAANYRTGLRGLFNGEADSLAVRELRYLQNRSAHLCRNNGYADIALTNWVSNTNGIGIVWKYPNGKKHKLMQDYWDKFCENPSYDGHGNMKTLQGVSSSSMFLTGNSYIRKLIRRDNPKDIPLKLQLIPSILHSINYTTINALAPSKLIHYGIEFENSIPVNYFFNKSILEQPAYSPQNTLVTTVPADELIHTFIRKEPGQWLGIPMLASVILSLYELDDLMTATVTKQKVAQSIAVIIEQTNNALAMQPVGPPITVLDEAQKSKIIMRNNAEEGQVLYLNKGEKATMFQGTDIGANFGILVEKELRKIATVAGALYHQLTGDTSGLNYSSLIGLSIQSRNRLEYLHNFIFIPLREKPIADAFKSLAMLYNNKVSTAIPYFQLPRWRGIDELKDIQADLLALQNGLATIPDTLAEYGISIEDIEADVENRKLYESMGISLTPAQSSPSMAQANNTNANSNSTGT